MTTVGQFTPGLTFNGLANGMILTTPDGRWSRDDADGVRFNLRLFVMNKGTSIGYAEVTNLPFPCADEGLDYALTCNYFGIKLPSGIVAVQASVQAGGSLITFDLGGNNQSFVPLTDQQFVSGRSRLDISGWYRAAP